MSVTLVSEVVRQNRTKLYLFTIDSVGASSTSGGFSINLKNIKTGSISGIRIVCNSTDYDLDLFEKASCTYPSVYEILRIEDINLEHAENELNASFYNRETTQVAYLYGIITNNDTINATGEISLQLDIEY